MPAPRKSPADEASEFYQIRIQPTLKAEFMRNCREQALNPSAVVRMLMEGWNRQREADQERLLAGQPKFNLSPFVGRAQLPRDEAAFAMLAEAFGDGPAPEKINTQRRHRSEQTAAPKAAGPARKPSGSKARPAAKAARKR